MLAPFWESPQEGWSYLGIYFWPPICGTPVLRSHHDCLACEERFPNPRNPQTLSTLDPTLPSESSRLQKICTPIPPRNCICSPQNYLTYYCYTGYWIAAKEFRLSYYNKGTLLSTMIYPFFRIVYIYICIRI